MTVSIPYPPKTRSWYIVGVLTFAWVIAYMDRQIIGILMEDLRGDFGLSDTQVSFIQGGAFAFFFVLAGIPIGRMVDQGNRRRILIVGVLLWSAATISCGMAQSFTQLVVARMFVGVGEACLAPATMSMVSDLIEPRRRGLAMGIIIAGTSLGSACSILIGGAVLQSYVNGGGGFFPALDLRAWQLAFVLVGLPGIVLAVVLLTISEPARRESTGRRSLSAAFAHFARHRMTFTLTYLTFTANAIIGYTVSAWIAVILMRIHHMPPGQLGMVLAATLLSASLLGTVAAGLFGDWRMSRSSLDGRLGVALLILPLQAIVMLVWSWTDSIPATVTVFALSGPVFSAMTSASCYPALNQITPNELRGQAIAIFVLVANLAGMAIAPTAVALITDHVLRDPMALKTAVIWIVFPTAVLGTLCALAARPYYRRTVASAEWNMG